MAAQGIPRNTSSIMQVRQRTPLHLVPSQPISVPLDPTLTAFLLHCDAKGLKPRTMELYKRTVRFFSHWLAKPLTETTKLDALTYISELRNEYQAQTIHTRALVLRVFFQFLVTEGITEVNPFATIKPKFQHKPQLTATDEQLTRLLLGCVASPSPTRNVLLATLLIDTGARKGEIGSLASTDLNLENSRVTFRESKTKPRIVALSPRLQSVAAKYLGEREPHESLWNVKNPYDLVEYVVKTYSRGELTPHSIRRHFAVSFLRSGGSETSLMRIAGWSSTAMVRIYTEAVGQELANDELMRYFSS